MFLNKACVINDIKADTTLIASPMQLNCNFTGCVNLEIYFFIYVLIQYCCKRYYFYVNCDAFLQQKPECCAGYYGAACHPCPGPFGNACNGNINGKVLNKNCTVWFYMYLPNVMSLCSMLSKKIKHF